MKLKINKQDMVNAGSYLNQRTCLLCAALRRRFKLPKTAIVISLSHETGYQLLNGKTKTFRLSKRDGKNIVEVYKGDRPKGEPFTVTLNPSRPSRFGSMGFERAKRVY